MEYGWLSAKKNGEEFLASAHAKKGKEPPYDSYFSLRLRTETEDGSLRELISFFEIEYDQPKTYLFGPYEEVFDGTISTDYFTRRADGDVSGDIYLLDESAPDNVFTITEVDTFASVVKGTFTVSYIIDPDREKKDPANPDKLKFTDGVFETSFKE